MNVKTLTIAMRRGVLGFEPLNLFFLEPCEIELLNTMLIGDGTLRELRFRFEFTWTHREPVKMSTKAAIIDALVQLHQQDVKRIFKAITATGGGTSISTSSSCEEHPTSSRSFTQPDRVLAASSFAVVNHSPWPFVTLTLKGVDSSAAAVERSVQDLRSELEAILEPYWELNHAAMVVHSNPFGM